MLCTYKAFSYDRRDRWPKVLGPISPRFPRGNRMPRQLSYGRTASFPF